MSNTTPEMNREAWLTEAVSSFVIPLIKKRTGLSPLKPIRISVGFPPSGGRTKATTGAPGTVGVCMTSQHHKHAHIFVHPVYDHTSLLADKGVFEILIHEVLHACLPEKVGHRKQFSQAATKIGLEGKPTATLLSDELREECKAWTEVLGEYPHDEAIWAAGKLSRIDPNVKCICPLCGYIARTTRKWLDLAGPPMCPQDMITMEEGGIFDENESLLGSPFHQTIEYPVYADRAVKVEARKAGVKIPRYDDRWSVRMNRYVAARGMQTDWHIIDHGERYRTVYEDDGVTPKTTVDPDTQKRVIVKIAILEAPPVRRYLCESRQDAIEQIEAIREGMDPQEIFNYEDDDLAQGAAPKTDDPDDPALDDLEDPEDDQWEDDEETVDSPESDTDPRFEWEKQRGIPIEAIDPEGETAKRESWGAQFSQRVAEGRIGESQEPAVESGEVDMEKILQERIKELEKLRKRGRR